MDKLVIYKSRSGKNATTLARIYVDTHTKLAQLSDDTGLSMARVLQICVDYAAGHVEYTDKEVPFYTVRKETVRKKEEE